MGGDLPEVPGYDELAAIARGGQAVVYRARHVKLDRVVALKVLAGAEVTETARRQFRREGRAMVAIGHHPAIVQIFDVGDTVAGTPYLAMEFCPGGSLADRVERDGPLPVADVVAIGITIASALSAVHGRGVFHRDVKPGNILQAEFGVKLADFGIVRAAGLEHTTTSQANTPVHAAPEVFHNEPATAASDVWSLGSTLYALLAGHPPFAEGSQSLAALVRRVTTEDPPPIDRQGGVPPALEELVRWALTRDPSLRPPSATALGRALAALGIKAHADEPEAPDPVLPSPRPGRPVEREGPTLQPEDEPADRPAAQRRSGAPARRGAQAVAGVRRHNAVPVRPTASGVTRGAPVVPRVAASGGLRPVVPVREGREGSRRLERVTAPAVAVTPIVPGHARQDAGPAVSAAGARALSLQVDRGEVRCGDDGTGELVVDLRNAGADYEWAEVGALGVPAGWVAIDPAPGARLAPGQQRSWRLLFRPPPGSAGSHTVEVVARLAADPNIRCSSRVELVLPMRMEVWLEPPTLTAGRTGVYLVCIRHPGTVPLPVDLRAPENERLEVACSPPRIEALPGAIVRATVAVTARHRLLGGGSRAHRFAIEVAGGGHTWAIDGEFVQQPVLGAGAAGEVAHSEPVPADP